MVLKQNEIKSVKSKELLQYYSNAHITYLRAMGHTKSNKNEMAREAYKSEILKRGLDLDATPKGIFNGDGSW